MGLTLDVRQSGIDVSSGNISIEIYDDASAGNLIYNSSDSFLNNITNGKLDIILGDPSSGIDLNLTYGTTYYMDLVVNNNDIDFNGIERQIFQSNVGNITQSRLNLTGTLSTHSLIPDGNATFDLGSGANFFRNLFLETLNIIKPLNTSQIEDVFLLNTGDTATGDYNFDSNTLFIDSANDFIGIRTSTPANALNVIGDANFTGTLTVGGAQITPSSNVSGGGTSGAIVKFTDTASIGNSIISESSDKIAIGTGTLSPTHMLSVFGSGNFTNDLIVFGLLDIGNIISSIVNTTHIVDRTLISDDLADSSINTTLILDRTILADDLADSSINTTLVLDRTLLSDDLADSSVNTTLILDATILESDLGFSALLRTDNVAFTNSTDEEFENNLSVEDSLITDYIFPQNESFVRIENITINQDLRVLGSSYLGSFIIKDDLSVGQTNITSSFTGIGSINPLFLLHLNVSDDVNESITPLLVLEKTNLSTGSGDGYGSSILFRLADDTGEVENVSMISGIFEDVSNGTELGALVFYTGYGDVNGQITNITTAEAMRITGAGKVGIGVSSPTHLLNIAGNANITSDLNVEGLCVAEDSLITLASGEKKQIKDIKAGEEVLSLNEETGKLVPNKVKEVLDMGYKPIYELVLETGKSVNTTATHPYLVKINSREKCEEYANNVWNKNNPENYDQENYCLRWVSVKDLKEGDEIAAQNLESSSLGLNTSTPDNPLSDLSPEKIEHFNSNANATYCTSFKCLEESFSASGRDSENSSLGIKFICPKTNSKTSSNSSLSSLDLLKTSPLCLSNSVSKNSGATKSNSLNRELSSNTIKELPFDNKEENTTLTSTTIFISNYSKYLFDKALFTSSENSSTSFSVNLDLATILCNRAISSNLDLITLLTTIDQSISETCLKNPISSGILIFNSAILSQEESDNENYLNVLKSNAPRLLGSVKSPLNALEILLVPSQKEVSHSSQNINNDVRFEKIISIKILEKQHVYDLAMTGWGEGDEFPSFIANDIIAHNTYLAGNVSLADNFTVDGSTFYVDASSNNVGIGTTAPGHKLEVSDGSTGAFTPSTGVGVVMKITNPTGGGTAGRGVGLRFGNTGSDSTAVLSVQTNSGGSLGDFYIQTFNGATYNNALVVTAAGNVGIGTAAPEGTQGLTINQSTNDDNILSLKSGDIAHGMTDYGQTETFGSFVKHSGTLGGLQIYGFSEDDTGLELRGWGTSDVTGKNGTARGYISLLANKKSGTGTVAAGANSNLVVIKDDGASTRFIFSQNGSAFADDVWVDNGFDLAEEYDISEFTEEATVLTIDLEHNNRMTPTTQSYQIISGIVSYHTAQLGDAFGNLREKYPQLQLHEYKIPTSVGIIGILPTKTTNKNGNIKRGDVLVSSDKKGYAMKADEKIAKTLNSKYIVGIALMPCQKDECIINVQR